MEQRSTQPDSTQHRYEIGDRVRVVESKSMMRDRLIGKTGTVTAIDVEPAPWFMWVELDTPVSTRSGARIFKGYWALPDELEAVS